MGESACYLALQLRGCRDESRTLKLNVATLPGSENNGGCVKRLIAKQNDGQYVSSSMYILTPALLFPTGVGEGIGPCSLWLRDNINVS